MSASPSDRRLLLVVQDTFAVSGRGLTVVPDVDLGSKFQSHITVELRRPDGTTIRAVALAQVPFITPAPQRRPHHVLTFATLTKDDVPIGTEVWMVEET